MGDAKRRREREAQEAKALGEIPFRPEITDKGTAEKEARRIAEDLQRTAIRGSLPDQKRKMVEVASDLRHAVYGIIRLRPTDNRDAKGNILYSQDPLGSGFFVSPTTFLSCAHVFNHPRKPHLPGDCYRLVRTMVNEQNVIGGMGINVQDIEVGKNLHLYPDRDLALLRLRPTGGAAYVRLDYGMVLPGREIGVAGYPLGSIGNDGALGVYSDFRYRVARGTVNAVYYETIKSDAHVGKELVPKIEVNFLFVPGNSGGPIFDVETGRVIAFVHGFNSVKIHERVENVNMIDPKPNGIDERYVFGIPAVYSMGISVVVAKGPIAELEAADSLNPKSAALTSGKREESETGPK
jgi:hypothetical protein